MVCYDTLIYRPPPAWYNRPYHHRFLSEPAIPRLQQPPVPLNQPQQDEMLLRLRQGNPRPDRPASMAAGSSGMAAAPGSNKGPVVSVTQTQSKAARRQSAYYPPAGQDFAIQINPPSSSAKDKKEKRKSGYYPPATQDFAIQVDVPAKKGKGAAAPAAQVQKEVKQKRRQSQFYPVAPEDLAIEIKAPPPPKEEIKVEKRKSRVSTSALMAPTMDPNIALEGFPARTRMPGMDVRSRRSSSSTMASFNTAYSSRDSFESRGMASSWGSQTSLESMASSPLKVVPAGRRTYADYQLQFQNQNQNWARNARPAPIKNTYKRKANPGEIFAALPGEVLELILEELKKLHLQPGSDSCATCWMRDCCSLALSARKWAKFARTALYEDIQIVGEEAPHLKKRYKLNHGGRLVLLRRTLRSSPQIAAIVRSLKVPRATMLPPGVSTDEYHDLVASVVMACPNFERLVGFYPTYSHTFTRLFHALSTRQKLTEMNWIVEPSPYQRQHKLRPSINGTVPPGDLQPQQSQDFFDHHANWSHLTSLTVHCRPGATLTPSVLLNDALNCLPVLHILHLSNLPSTSFSDRNLACLPSTLKKLTLSHLPGVTTAGITAFATRKSSSSSSLSSLTLINTQIDSLPALCRILSSLPSLQTFNLVQPSPPILPADENVMLFPYLASPSLRKLHWDIPTLHQARASEADTILARSISAGGFPSLRTLRAPNDPEGVFQSVSAPRERVDLPADRYRCSTAGGPGWNPRMVAQQHHARTGSRGSSFSVATAPVGEIHPPFAPRGDIDWTPPRSLNSDLHTARLAAQQRLEAARQAPRYFINVVDEQGATVETHGVGAFLGDVRSKVRYHLLPDVGGGSDESGGLVGVGEMLADNGEEVGVVRPSTERVIGEKESSSGSSGWGMGGLMGRRSSSAVVLGRKERVKERERSRSRDRNGEVDGRKVREGCTGKWNLVVGGDKKDRLRWEHTERGRWRGVVLS
ncbi:hypothetical protein GE09DRAFT_1084692 [Coniochaeta sp. 2T2.1]|nr:hypothetical protein GE09DRAFT_1084692 [Coniochaeta sp. 2T2.1]